MWVVPTTTTLLLAMALLFGSTVAVAPAPSNRLMFDTLGAPASAVEAAAAGFALLGRAAPDSSLHFRIALRQQNVETFTALAADIATPGHPRYQAFLTHAEVHAMLAPPKAAVMPLVRLLEAAGMTVEADTIGLDYLAVTSHVAAFESVFECTLYKVLDTVRGVTVAKIAGAHYSLPTSVAGVVDFVQGPPQWHRVRPVLKAPKSVGIPTPSNDIVVPLTIANQYQTGNRTVTTAAVVGVAEFVSGGISRTDLAAFCKGAGVPDVASKVKCVTGSCWGGGGGNDDNTAQTDGECTLDVEMQASTFFGAVHYYYSSQWLLAVAQDWAKGATGAVYSISWLTNEQQGGQQQNNRVNMEYQKLGTMGITVVASSGDSGAVGGSGSLPMNPGFPAASSFVVSVGATELVQGSCGGSSGGVDGAQLPPVCTGQGYTCCAKGVEVPADEPAGGYATGGGFSVFEPRPAFQKAAVEEYLSNATIPKPPANTFNASNRAYPDLAALGNNMIMYQGSWQISGGTSAAAPIVASLLGLINNHLLSKGKKPIGFVNPLLYKMAASDKATVTSIGNLSTNNKDGHALGYTSNPNGWDPVTGLGTLQLQPALKWIDDNMALFRGA